MASLPEILQFAWPGNEWSCANHGDLSEAYATLIWDVGNSDLKPSLAEVRAQEVDAGAHWAAEYRKDRRIDKLLEERDAFLTAFDIIGDALAELAQKGALRNGQTLDPTVVQRVQAFRQRVAAAKAVT